MQYFKNKLDEIWAFEDDVKDIYKFKCVPKNLISITEEEAISILKNKQIQQEVKDDTI